MLRGFAISVLIAVLLACAQGSASAAKKTQKRSSAVSCSATSTIAVDEATRERASDAVLCLVNRERRARGLRSVRASKPLERAAAQHSRAMVRENFVSHRSPSGDSARMRVLKAGYNTSNRNRDWLMGETLAWGAGAYATPVELVAALMESPPHRRTVLNKRFRDVGVGMAIGAPEADIDMEAATVTIAFGRR